MIATASLPDRLHRLPNSTYVVETAVGDVLVNSPPETLKWLLALERLPPAIVLLPPDMPPGQQLGSSGFVRQGICYASVEFLLYYTFFSTGKRTTLLTPTEAQAERLRLMLQETVNGPSRLDQYGAVPWLKAECEAVGHYAPIGGPLLWQTMADVQSLEHTMGLLGGTTTVVLEADQFVFREGERIVARVPTQIAAAPRPVAFAPARPLLRRELTLQFVGGSDGFDPHGITTCFLAYLGIEGRSHATLFDAAAYLRQRLGHLGISPQQISEVFLSHLHEDHLAGLPELLLMGGSRVRLLTADVIYQSLLRHLGAMLALPESEVASLFDYVPLNPGQPLEMEGRRFESIFAVHSIPTLAVRVNGLCYSGDMRYDEVLFANLAEQGLLSPARLKELIDFAEGALVLVQDAGGGEVHTTVTPEVLAALAAKSQRVVLAHTRVERLALDDGDWQGRVEVAGSGYVTSIGASIDSPQQQERVETLSACPLFARLPLEERVALASETTLHHWDDQSVIIEHGEVVDGRAYIVHQGLVEIWEEGRLIQVMGRGSSLGERGVLQGLTRLGTLVARGQVELLTMEAEQFLPVALALSLPEAFERADWLWTLPAFRDLPWATLLDLALDFQPRHLATGGELYKAGDPGYECYLLVRGTLHLVDEQGKTVKTLARPGEVLGGWAALRRTTRRTTARAAQLSEVWTLPAAALQRVEMIYPNLLLHLRALSSAG